MKYDRSHASFIENLTWQMKSLKRMKPGDVHVFTINATYGRYQIVIGPLMDNHCRSVEINGEIHHLFVSPKSISPNPSKRQVRSNLKNTVIMNELLIHLRDPLGDGKHLSIKQSDAHPREYINLAGKKGQILLNKVESSGRLTSAAYKIIQEDILRSLRKERRTS